MTDYRSRYRDHKHNAKMKGIGFELSFEQWLEIWKASGHLAERGRRRGQYVMARLGDRGPYAIDNVKIISHEQNIKERRFTPQELARRSAARIGQQHLGPKKHSEQTLLKMSQSQQRRWAAVDEQQRLIFSNKCNQRARDTGGKFL